MKYFLICLCILFLSTFFTIGSIVFTGSNSYATNVSFVTMVISGIIFLVSGITFEPNDFSQSKQLEAKENRLGDDSVI